MKHTLLAGIATIAFVTAAAAADMPAPPVEAAFVEPTAVWDGWFAGIQGGYGWGDIDYDFLDPSGDIDDVDEVGSLEAEGFVGGLYYGRNWQSGDWVYGLEGSISYADLTESVTFDYNSQLTIDGVDIVDDGPLTFEVGLQAFSTTRAKVGLAFDNFLLFAAGGLTVGFVEAELSGVDGSVDDDDFVLGWTVGAGVEAMLAENWSARVEYLYLDYGDETFFGGTDGEVDVELDAHVVRGGIAYHF